MTCERHGCVHWVTTCEDFDQVLAEGRARIERLAAEEVAEWLRIEAGA